MNRTAVIPAIVVISLLCLSYLVQERPAMARIGALQAQIEVADARQETDQQNLVQLQTLLGRMPEPKPNQRAGLAEVPGLDRVGLLYHLLDSLAARDGNRLEEITPSLEETIRFLAQKSSDTTTLLLPVSLTIRGRYQNLAELVGRLEHSPYWGKLLLLNLTGAAEIQPDCRLTVTFAANLSDWQE